MKENPVVVYHSTFCTQGSVNGTTGLVKIETLIGKKSISDIACSSKLSIKNYQ